MASVQVFQSFLSLTPGLLGAHAVCLNQYTACAILLYDSDAHANNAVEQVHGKYAQIDGVVLMNQKLIACRPVCFTVCGVGGGHECCCVYMVHMHTSQPHTGLV